MLVVPENSDRVTALITLHCRQPNSDLYQRKTKYHEIISNANLMQQGNFIDVFLARHVSGTHAHHQEH